MTFIIYICRAFKYNIGRVFLHKWANPCLFLFIFVFFSSQFKYRLINKDVVLSDWTPGRRMVGTDVSTELWRPKLQSFARFNSSLFFDTKTLANFMKWNVFLITGFAGLEVLTLRIHFLHVQNERTQRIASLQRRRKSRKGKSLKIVFNWAIPGLFFFFRLFNTVDSKQCSI